MPKLRLRELFFGGTQFCCCLPVRAGVITMSFLGIVFSGILAVVLWYEVATTPDLTSTERAMFVLGALLETLLFVASVLGFAGTIARKQLFVQIYAYFIYFHFVVNLAVAIYLLYVITRFSNRAAYNACLDTIKNPAAQEQCVGFLQVARGVYFGVAAAVLLIEMYGAIIVARYLNQIQREKRTARSSRMLELEGEYNLSHKRPPTINHSSQGDRETLLDASSPVGMSLQSPRVPGMPSMDRYASDDIEFNPYEDTPGPSTRSARPESYGAVPTWDADGTSGTIVGNRSFVGLPPVEAGYGGGYVTHEGIVAQEKAVLREQEQDDSEDETSALPPLDETKSPTGPPPIPRLSHTSVLPRYTLSDPASIR